MTPAAELACKPMLTQLDFNVRRGVNQRVDAMVRELDFLVLREDRNLALLRSVGWKDDHFHVIFFLNSIYQRVLGPERSAARTGPEGLGTSIPVKHGSEVFDLNSAKKVEAAMRTFTELTRTLNLNVHWLYANTCRDLVFVMAGMQIEERPEEE